MLCATTLDQLKHTSRLFTVQTSEDVSQRCLFQATRYLHTMSANGSERVGPSSGERGRLHATEMTRRTNSRHTERLEALTLPLGGA